MKKAIIAVAALLLLAALAEGIILLRMPADPWRIGAVLASLSLLLGAFVGLTDSSSVRKLRHWALRSVGLACGIPLLLLVPYLIYALGTDTFSLRAALKLTAYIAVPISLLLPDRWHRAARAGWRDFAAILALAFPIGAHWLGGIWTWPQGLYFFQPLTAVCVGAYAFVVIRNLEDVGYRLIFRKGDLVDGLSNFVAFALLGIPLGYVLHFIHFHSHGVSVATFVFQFLGIYLTIAIPEELLFRGILQNLLVKSILPGPKGQKGQKDLLGLLVASALFGASHLHHPPVPNWKYGIMATLAGIFYGNAYRTRHRLSASAFTHSLVDTTWHFWF